MTSLTQDPYLSDEAWLIQAQALAHQAQQQGEVPVGAILVQNHQILSVGKNECIAKHDPTAHAEIVAIRKAGLLSGNYRIPNATLYTTLEPCIMCFSACIQARIDRIFYGTPDLHAGAITLLVSQMPHWNHSIITGISEHAEQYSSFIKHFFKEKRGKK